LVARPQIRLLPTKGDSLSEQSEQEKDGVFVLSEKAIIKREVRLKKQEAIKIRRTEREAVRAENYQKHLARLEGLHSEICESTHRLISHEAWVNIMIKLSVKFESTKNSPKCLNCDSVIPPGEISWVFSILTPETSGRKMKLPSPQRADNNRRSKKTTKIHYCQQCGLPLLLPIPSTSKKKKKRKKQSNLPNPGDLVPHKGVRLFSGQRRNS